MQVLNGDRPVATLVQKFALNQSISASSLTPDQLQQAPAFYYGILEEESGLRTTSWVLQPTNPNAVGKTAVELTKAMRDSYNRVLTSLGMEPLDFSNPVTTR